MIVMKFGGTSVENDTAINRVADIVLGRLDERPVVVVSAIAGVTDALPAMSGAAASGFLPEALSCFEGSASGTSPFCLPWSAGRAKPPFAWKSKLCSIRRRTCCAAFQLWGS
jgi:hypothetical protein